MRWTTDDVSDAKRRAGDASSSHARAMGGATARGDDRGTFAVVDLVAHLYRGTADDRRALGAVWARYTAQTEAERRAKGFELVRMHHATLTRVLRDDPCGEFLDIDDVRMAWEELVDALRDATGASAASPATPETMKSYDALEGPVMKRNESFNQLARDLENVIAKMSPSTSGANTPEGSTRGVERISSSGMLLNIGTTSREPSVRGGSAFHQSKSAVGGDELRAKLGDA